MLYYFKKNKIFVLLVSYCNDLFDKNVLELSFMYIYMLYFLTKNSMRAMQRNNSLIVDKMTPLTCVYIHNDRNSVILSISQISIYK